MLLQDFPEIHAVELVARQDHDVFVIVLQKIPQVLPDGISRSLVPTRPTRRLLGGEDLHKAARESIKRVTLVNVAMQRRGVKLCENINVADVRIDAVADR